MGPQYRVVRLSPKDAQSIITSTGFLSNNGQVRILAALVIKGAWIKHSARLWPVDSPTSGMENRCYMAFNKLGLSDLCAKSKARLHIARGPLLAVRVALEWLAEEMRRLVTKSRSSGNFSMIHQPSFLFAQ